MAKKNTKKLETKEATPITKRPVGRPQVPNKEQRPGITVYFPASMLRDIDITCGGNRTQWINDACAEKLAKGAAKCKPSKTS
jgi:hypothetical protein